MNQPIQTPPADSHPDPEIQATFRVLMNRLCTWEGSRGRQSPHVCSRAARRIRTWLLQQHTPDDIGDGALLERFADSDLVTRHGTGDTYEQLDMAASGLCAKLRKLQAKSEAGSIERVEAAKLASHLDEWCRLIEETTPQSRKMPAAP